MKKRLDPKLYYFCRLGRRPNMGKLLGCCFGKGCPHLKTVPRKNLVQIERAA